MKRNNIIVLVLLMCSGAIAQNVGSQRKSTEDAFIARMKEMSGSEVSEGVVPDTALMSKAEGKSYYVHPGETYIIDGISSATYYNYRDGQFQPLCDKRFPKETIANRLLLLNSELPDGEMRLKFQKYRYETDSVNIRFKQFMRFCGNENYKMYIGIEKSDNEELKVDVFLYNGVSQWLHIFNLSCPTDKVTEEGLSMAGDAWLFIPTSNLRELMGEKLPDDFMQRLLNKTKDKQL